MYSDIDAAGAGYAVGTGSGHCHRPFASVSRSILNGLHSDSMVCRHARL